MRTKTRSDREDVLALINDIAKTWLEDHGKETALKMAAERLSRTTLTSTQRANWQFVYNKINQS